MGDKAAAAAKSEIMKRDKLGRQGGSGSKERNHEGRQVGRQGGSGPQERNHEGDNLGDKAAAAAKSEIMKGNKLGDKAAAAPKSQIMKETSLGDKAAAAAKSVPGACPPYVCLVSALAAPPNLVRHVSAICRVFCVVACPACVCLAFRRAPNLVQHMSALSLPNLVHLVSALKRLQTLFAMCPPCVRFGFPLKTFATMSRSGLVSPCRLRPRLQALCLPCRALCPPCVRSLFFFVLPLSGGCSPFLRSLSVFGRVYDLALAGPLSALCPLFGFCAFVCSVSVVVRLGWGFCAARLPADRMLTLSRQRFCLP